MPSSSGEEAQILEPRCLVFEEEEELVKWWSVEFPAEDVRKA